MTARYYLQNLDASNFAAAMMSQGGCKLPGFSLPTLTEFSISRSDGESAVSRMATQFNYLITSLSPQRKFS
jgi:hypothetical protein